MEETLMELSVIRNGIALIFLATGVCAVMLTLILVELIHITEVLKDKKPK